MALPLTYNFRSLRVRWQVTLLAVAGIALAVAVFVVLMAMVDGFRWALRGSGSPLNGVVFQRGSNSELTSWVRHEHALSLGTDPRVTRDSDGEPLASCEIVVVTTMDRRADGKPTNVTIRGVTAASFRIRQGLRVVEGRTYRPGLYELVVGSRARERIRGLEVGQQLRFQKHEWDVVGTFEAGGSAFESEIWGDAAVMRAALDRYGGCNTLVMRLTTPAALADLDRDLRASPAMQLQIKPEQKYYEDQAAPVAEPLMALLSFVVVVMGTGAVFGVMNTMDSVVSARTREIGTLRVLGFSRLSVLLAFSLESVLLALSGGALGCLLALPANSLTAATGATAGFAEVAWAFRVTPTAMGAGLTLAVLLGLLGGLLPAFRAAALPISAALRED